MASRSSLSEDPASGAYEAVASAQQTWDHLAARYGRQERWEHRTILAAIDLADTARSEHLVDLATGTGLLLRLLAPTISRPAQALGVDRSAAMLAQVGRLPAGWQTLQDDVRSPLIKSGSADVVTCCYLLHLLDAHDRVAVLRQARRLLAPGGASRLVVATVWVAPRRPAGRLLAAALAGAAAAAPASLGGLRPLDPTEDLRAAGFEITGRVEVQRGGYPSLVLRATPADQHWPAAI